jgi:MHS family proline/betaine transporter-like MFS transporter
MVRAGNLGAGTVAADSSDARMRRRAVVAGTIGNVLTAYDFIVYSFFSPVIGRLFFPDIDPAFELLASLATFGVGFIVRPLGGIVLGGIADRRGRRTAMTLAISLMTGGILIFTVTPTFATIGVAAPAAIVFARIIQGFSAGGEFPSVTAYLSEYSLAQHRGFYISWQQSAQFAASLIGAFVCTLVVRGLNADQVASWGWRVPFALGLLVGPIGFYIRNRLADTPVFRAAPDQASPAPLRESARHHWRAILGSFGMVVCGTAAVYVIVLFLPIYATRQFGLIAWKSMAASAAMSAGLVVLCLFFGALSDRIGRKSVVLGGSIALMVLTYPLFSYFRSAPGIGSLLAIEAVLAIAIAAATGPSFAMMAEAVPTRVRTSSLSLSYNFGVAIFGGFGQFIVVWLILRTGDVLAPAYYVLAAGAVGALAVAFMPDYTGTAFDEPWGGGAPGPVSR